MLTEEDQIPVLQGRDVPKRLEEEEDVSTHCTSVSYGGLRLECIGLYTYVSGEVLGALLLLGLEQIHVDDLVLRAHLLQAQQHPRHVDGLDRPEHLHRRHCCYIW